MAAKTWRVALTGLLLLGACGDDADNEQDGTQPEGGSALNGTIDGAVANPTGNEPGDNNSNSNPGNTGVTDAGPSVPDAANPAMELPYDYKSQDVELTADLVIPKGKTVRVGEGVHFLAKGNFKIDVQGTLVVEGTKAAPVTFAGPSGTESWAGIVVESGGTLFFDGGNVSNARYGIHALPGSTYSIDHSTFENSFKGAVLEANGSVANSVFKGVSHFPSITNEVTIDDSNGFLTILNASPTVTNSRFDGSGGFTDMVRIGGSGSPSFDHCVLNKSHCGFHINGANNNSPRITNTVFEDLAYGIMAYTSKPIVENSVFRNNSNDIGTCSGATKDNTPMMKGNFFANGAIRLDAGCTTIGTKDSSPASSANPTAGTSGI